MGITRDDWELQQKNLLFLKKQREVMEDNKFFKNDHKVTPQYGLDSMDTSSYRALYSNVRNDIEARRRAWRTIKPTFYKQLENKADHNARWMLDKNGTHLRIEYKKVFCVLSPEQAGFYEVRDKSCHLKVPYNFTKTCFPLYQRLGNPEDIFILTARRVGMMDDLEMFQSRRVTFGKLKTRPEVTHESGYFAVGINNIYGWGTSLFKARDDAMRKIAKAFKGRVTSV